MTSPQVLPDWPLYARARVCVCPFVCVCVCVCVPPCEVLLSSPSFPLICMAKNIRPRCSCSDKIALKQYIRVGCCTPWILFHWSVESGRQGGGVCDVTGSRDPGGIHQGSGCTAAAAAAAAAPPCGRVGALLSPDGRLRGATSRKRGNKRRARGAIFIAVRVSLFSFQSAPLVNESR